VTVFTELIRPSDSAFAGQQKYFERYDEDVAILVFRFMRL
jgi:hypothetical protein